MAAAAAKRPAARAKTQVMKTTLKRPAAAPKGVAKASKSAAQKRPAAAPKGAARAPAAASKGAGAASGAPDPSLFGPDKTPKPKEIAAMLDATTPWSSKLRPAPLRQPALHVMTWNVAGLKALMQKRPDAIKQLVDKEKPDVIFLQETKIQEADIEAMQAACVPAGWNSAWQCSKQKLGYSGVAALWRNGVALTCSAGIGLPEADTEGRCLTLELPRYFLVGGYVPNAGDGLKRLDFRLNSWEPKIAKHLASRQQKKPTIYCGDMNVCHMEIDLWGNHGPNSKGAAYTPQERQAFAKLLKTNGLVDAFRHKHPNVRAFSYFSYRGNGRAKNQGWRLDYCLVPEKLAPRIHDAYILTDVQGSDHCPTGVVLM
eukprot:TRINITY_DN6959_c0_g1_i2.p1 TRINITY_DN6959_c0_g1~~TRINITY_DN6959_c0_g1_i2.p1  ORF type:complete len:405 (+),score=82.33 TRINITY_DN6959_c0_g1_i2:103-1215(+)